MKPRHAAALALIGLIRFCTQANIVIRSTMLAMTNIEKITEKLDEIASRAGTRRRDVGQMVDALRVAVSTIVILGAPPTRMTPKERLKVCDDAIERIAQELGA
jgi:hypothetical protein